MTRKALCSLITYALASAICLVSMHLMLLVHVNKYVGVSVGGGVLVVAFILLNVFFREKQESLLILLFLPIAAIACGLAISSLYVHLGTAPEIKSSLCIWGAYVGLFLVYCLLAYIPFFRQHPYFCLTIYGLLVLAGGIVGISLSSTVIFSLVLLLFLLFISCLATLVAESKNRREQNYYLAMFYFIAMFFIVVIVLVVIGGADGCDSCDGGDCCNCGGIGDGGYYKTKKNPYDYI